MPNAPRQSNPIRCRRVIGASFTNQPVTQNAIAAKVQRTVTNKESVVYVRNMINEEIVTKVQADKEKIPYSPISIHEVNRVKVLSRDYNQLFKDVKYAPGLSRDEYPYASTIEGGSDGYWAYVPVHEQSVQGGKLQGLYKRLLSSGSSEFDVVLA